MANKRLYDEKTGEGWAKVAGKWHYFRDGKILELGPIPGLRDADQRLKTWRDTTKKKVKKAVEPHAEQIGKGFLLAGKSIQDTSKQVGEGFQIAAKGAQDASKKYVYDPVNKVPGLWKDLGDRTIGSGEFDDKGRELSVFELRRQNLKYRKMENNNTDDDLLSEEIDLPDGGSFNMMDNLYATYTAEPTGDFTKMWEGVDLGNMDPYSRLNFKNSMDNTYWLTEGMLGATHSKITKDNQNKFAATLKHSDNKQLGSPSDELAIKTELGKNLRKTNLGGTDPGQSLWLGKNSTWSMGGNVVAPKVGTPEAEAMMNIPETPETTETAIAEEIVSDTPDIKVESGKGVSETSKLVDQSVKVDPVTPAVAPAPAAGPAPIPETFLSKFWDFLNNRGGK